MTKVVFVGDQISRLNLQDDIPFVGARCFKTLVQWIKVLNPDYYTCYNSNSLEDIGNICVLHFMDGFKVVALGNKASQRLTKYGIEHYKMDHPSGRNRKLNDKTYVQTRLDICKIWLYS